MTVIKLIMDTQDSMSANTRTELGLAVDMRAAERLAKELFGERSWRELFKEGYLRFEAVYVHE